MAPREDGDTALLYELQQERAAALGRVTARMEEALHDILFEVYRVPQELLARLGLTHR
jgi:hypothetical protein